MSDIIYRENIWEKLVWVMSIVNTFYEWTIFTGKLDLPHNSTRGQIIIIYFFKLWYLQTLVYRSPMEE